MPGFPYNNVNWKIVPTRLRMVKGIWMFNMIFLFYIFLTLTRIKPKYSESLLANIYLNY
jgi:hypothetical protein